MVKEDRIIVSLTTWSKRINNIPVVLDTIFAQTLPPDLVVLNLAYEEQIPESVREYINIHDIEVNRVPDTKVYKKLIPTLKRYPNDCVISIDDDWLYPEGMIADFIDMHKRYPNNPISGNREILFNMQCHCGCASLTKAEYFGEYLELINDEIIINCPSDDIVYTFFANKAGFPYVRTEKLYFTNMNSYNGLNGYSAFYVAGGGIEESYNYLGKKFGIQDNFVKCYFEDSEVANIVYEICKKNRRDAYIQGLEVGGQKVYNSTSYKLGNQIIKPFIWFKSLLHI